MGKPNLYTLAQVEQMIAAERARCAEIVRYWLGLDPSVAAKIADQITNQS